mgnify:CR=1 FL=1
MANRIWGGMRQESDDFYRHFAQRYSEVSKGYLDITYDNVSHPKLTGDKDIIARMQEMIPPNSRGLDAGCGAGARDVFLYWMAGYDIFGVDAVPENVQTARDLHPEISDRVSVADLSMSLDIPTASLDFVLCNAVIQHIVPEIVKDVTLPELARILKVDGMLQLMFKVGRGTGTVFDKEYDSYRSFHLYTAETIVEILSDLCLEVIPRDEISLSGLIYFTDQKPMEHCVLFARKLNLQTFWPT